MRWNYIKLYLRLPYIQTDPTAILSMQEPVPTVVELQPATAMTIKPAKTPVMASTSNSSSPPLLPKFLTPPFHVMSSFSSHSSCWQHAVHHYTLLPHTPSPPSSPDSRGDMSEEQLGPATVHSPLYHQPRRRASVPLQGKFPLFCLLPPSPSIG